MPEGKTSFPPPPFPAASLHPNACDVHRCADVFEAAPVAVEPLAEESWASLAVFTQVGVMLLCVSVCVWRR